jgi:hypothetical protein
MLDHAHAHRVIGSGVVSEPDQVTHSPPARRRTLPPGRVRPGFGADGREGWTDS